MKTIVRQRWIGPESYVEVCYRPNWSADGLGLVDIDCYVIDPRKAQYHKPKFWQRGGSSHGLAPRIIECLRRRDLHYRGRVWEVALKILEEDLSLTSSDRRAIAS